MKKIIIKIIAILAILMLLFSINSKVFAWSEVIKDGQSFISKADPSKVGIDEGELQDLSGYLYNILLAAGVVIAVIVATVLGIQFMIGGAEGQAKVKEMLIPFVAGCIIVFGGFGIWKLALTIGNRVESATEITENNNNEDSERTTYTKIDGKLYCDNCGDELSAREQRKGQCSDCGKFIIGI